MKSKGERGGKVGESLQITVQCEIYKGEGVEKEVSSKSLRLQWSSKTVLARPKLWEASGQNCPSEETGILY